MNVKMGAKDSTVEITPIKFEIPAKTKQKITPIIPSITENNIENFLQEVRKEVEIYTNNDKSKMIQLKNQLKNAIQTLKSTLKLTLTNQKLKISGFTIPWLNTSGLPDDLVAWALGLIVGLMLLSFLVSIITSQIASMLNMFNKSTEADAWHRNIRKGLFQSIMYPICLLVFALTIYFIFQTSPIGVPIFKHHP